jgi:hypothetical protein
MHLLKPHSARLPDGQGDTMVETALGGILLLKPGSGESMVEMMQNDGNISRVAVTVW